MVNNIAYNNKKRGKTYIKINNNHFGLFSLLRDPNEPKISQPYKKLKGFP